MAEGSQPVCLATPVESKLYFRKHLANFLKMLRGSGGPGVGHETPDELTTMSGETECLVCPGPALSGSGEGRLPGGKPEGGQWRQGSCLPQSLRLSILSCQRGQRPLTVRVAAGSRSILLTLSRCNEKGTRSMWGPCIGATSDISPQPPVERKTHGK